MRIDLNDSSYSNCWWEKSKNVSICWNLGQRYEKCTLSAIIHFAVIADWISSKNDREAGAGATPKLEILSTKITSSFMSRDLHQQTLDLFLNLARQGDYNFA